MDTRNIFKYLSKLKSDLSEISRLTKSGWKPEIANIPKVFLTGIAFTAGWHFYESNIKPRISNDDLYDDEIGSRRRAPRPPGPGR